MAKINHYLSLREKRKRRVRSKLYGTSLRPRLTVSRSNKYFYMQIINDEKGVTLISASDVKLRKANKSADLTKTASAVEAAKALLIEMKKEKIVSLVFDRGQYKYHGRVKAVAELLREAGIKV